MFEIHERLPSLEEYRRICSAVGWEDVVNFDAAADSLPRSLHAVVATVEGEVVGMGRVVGDGAIYFYLQDVAVLPEHRRSGIGSAVVGALVDWVRDNAPPQSFVGLFAVQGTERLYARFGFAQHSAMRGMFTTTPPASPQP